MPALHPPARSAAQRSSGSVLRAPRPQTHPAQTDRQTDGREHCYRPFPEQRSKESKLKEQINNTDLGQPRQTGGSGASESTSPQPGRRSGAWSALQPGRAVEVVAGTADEQVLREERGQRACKRPAGVRAASPTMGPAWRPAWVSPAGGSGHWESGWLG